MRNRTTEAIVLAAAALPTLSAAKTSAQYAGWQHPGSIYYYSAKLILPDLGKLVKLASCLGW